MKPIIVNMNEMSDSTEVYESRPNPFFVYFIYLILALLVITVAWMCLSEIDIVVKANGMFRSEEAAIEVSSGIGGEVMECNITEGQYVEEGDVLFVINTESIENTIEDTKLLLADVEQRINILSAYDQYLKGTKDALDSYGENKYYAEFAGRKQLLELNTQNTGVDIETQKVQYQKELENVFGQISQYEVQIAKLRMAEKCVKNRVNNFDVSESYYESIVSSYISNYNLTASSYDTQMAEYQKQIEALEKQLAEAQKMATEEIQPATDATISTTEESQTITEGVVSVTGESQSAIDVVDTESIKQQITALEENITKTTNGKVATLENLELQQIATLEQQIETINNNLNSLSSNQALIQAQLDVLNGKNNGKTTEVNKLTEQQNVATELLNYEAKKTEYENTLKQYDLESGNAKIVAKSSGYIYLNQELKEGSFISQGTNICQILPESSSKYYAEVYVENADIGKLQEGQEVKFEIVAYPSSEYGYFTGVIDSISKDIKVEQNSGSAYYLIKVRCDNTTVTNKDGKTSTIMNGMACQAKVVVDEENVLRYLLEKVDLLD